MTVLWCQLLVGKGAIIRSVRLGCNVCDHAIRQISDLIWETFRTVDCSCRSDMLCKEAFAVILMYVKPDACIERNCPDVGRIVGHFDKSLSIVPIDGTEASTEIVVSHVGSKVKAYVWSWSQRVQFILKRAI